VHVLERFVAQSQFIIITHNKRTIAKADILYGVTMEERGVSKLVGMKLTQPREVAVEQAGNGNGHGETTTQRHLALAGR
jgi:chromosome segregation protein